MDIKTGLPTDPATEVTFLINQLPTDEPLCRPKVTPFRREEINKVYALATAAFYSQQQGNHGQALIQFQRVLDTIDDIILRLEQQASPVHLKRESSPKSILEQLREYLESYAAVDYAFYCMFTD